MVVAMANVNLVAILVAAGCDFFGLTLQLHLWSFPPLNHVDLDVGALHTQATKFCQCQNLIAGWAVLADMLRNGQVKIKASICSSSTRREHMNRWGLYLARRMTPGAL